MTAHSTYRSTLRQRISRCRDDNEARELQRINSSLTQDIFIAANHQLGPRPPQLSNQHWNHLLTKTIKSVIANSNTMSGFPPFNTPPVVPSSAAKSTPSTLPRTPILPPHFTNPRAGERAATPQQCIQCGHIHAANNAVDGLRDALGLLAKTGGDHRHHSPVCNLNFGGETLPVRINNGTNGGRNNGGTNDGTNNNGGANGGTFNNGAFNNVTNNNGKLFCVSCHTNVFNNLQPIQSLLK